MTDSPILSVIIPVHNMERYIAKCLSPILSLEDDTIEVIVVDDGSTDNTKAILRSMSDQRLRVVSTSRGGPSAARNVGFSLSRGKYILFFDADDVPVVENWPSILLILAARPKAALVYGARRIFEGDADNFPRRPWKESYPAADEVVPLIFKRNFIPMGAAFVKREAVEAAGLWNETLRHGEDWEMWSRLACIGQFVHWPVLVMARRSHRQSATGALVRHDAHDPGLAAVDTIFNHAEVRRRTGADHQKLKRSAIAWRTYFWGTTLIRSGATWSGVQAIISAINKDPSLFFFLCGIPRRVLRRRMERIHSVSPGAFASSHAMFSDGGQPPIVIGQALSSCLL